MVRKSISLAFALFSILYLIPGCSKSDSKSDDGTASIVNKWFYVNRITWDSPAGGSILKDTSGYPSGSYADFRNDGKVYSYIPDGSGVYEHDTARYQYNNMVLILTRKTGEKDTMAVQTLTNNSFTTYLKDNYPGGSEEVWTNCKK